MSGIFSVGGLISGLDSDTLISQLLAIERQPILRLEERIAEYEDQKEALQDFRSLLTTFRNSVQDFRLGSNFNDYTTSSSDETILTATVSSANPVIGAFEVETLQLASATVAESSGTIGSNLNTSAALDSSGLSTGVEAGAFTVNGVEFTVDPTTDSLDDIMAMVNSSAAGVTMSYDAATDTVSFENSTAGDTSIINFGSDDDESNLLEALAVTESTQATGASGSTVVTSTRHLGAINSVATLNEVSFADGAITAGSFSINGIAISVDPTADSISDVLERINSSDAGVTASYDSAADGIRIVSNTLGSRTIRFGSAGDTSNFLSVTNLDNATQTQGRDSQFRINGGEIQTRNTNEVSDAISGVTLNLLSVDTSTVTISNDYDAAVEDVEEFIAAFNDVVNSVSDLTGSDGVLRSDSTLTNVESFMWQNIFATVNGVGDYDSLISLGISTGDDFDSASTSNLQLDSDTFMEAMRDDMANVLDIFTNEDGTGIADLMVDYLTEATKATGFLNTRAKSNGSIDSQIESLDAQIERKEASLEAYETRLRKQFTNLETMSLQYQRQSSALSALSSF